MPCAGCRRREAPPLRVLFLGGAVLSSLIVVFIYEPATLRLLHTQLLQRRPGVADGNNIPVVRHKAAAAAGRPVVDGALGRSTHGATTSRGPPSSLAEERKRGGGRRGKGNHARKLEVFHDKESFLEDYREMKENLKIFVYPHREDDPFAHALRPAAAVAGGNYASESYFKKVLVGSRFVTEDPSRADLFFLPFSVVDLRFDRRVGVRGLPRFVAEYVSGVGRRYPFWNRTAGSDHFYVACHSAGRSAMDGAEELRLNAIQVVCSASQFLPGFVAHKDATLPQIWPRKGNHPKIFSPDRKNLAFFAGAMNSAVRRKLVQTWKNDSEIIVHSGHTTSTSYSEGLLGSRFCLHVRGFEVNTARAADAIYHGCVPVILADHYELPFSDVLDWSSFAVVVAAPDVPRLKEILRGVSPGRYAEMRRNVLRVRRHFKWHLSPRDYDAFHMVLYELWLRRAVARLNI